MIRIGFLVAFLAALPLIVYLVPSVWAGAAVITAFGAVCWVLTRP